MFFSYRMRVKDAALIGKRWGSRFEVIKGRGDGSLCSQLQLRPTLLMG
jgi:hypothetical protein